MKAKTILLIIGILGIIASVYVAITDGNFSDQIISFVCSASLIWGYFELDKKEKQGNS